MTTTQEYKRFQSRYLKDDDVNEYNRLKELIYMYISHHPSPDYNFLNSINKNFISLNIDEYIRPYLDSLEIMRDKLYKNKELLDQKNIEIRTHNVEIEGQMSHLSKELVKLQNEQENNNTKEQIKNIEQELEQLSTQIQPLFNSQEINDNDLQEIKTDIDNIISNFILINKLYKTYTLNNNKTIYNDDNLIKMKQSFYRIYRRDLSLNDQIEKGKELSSVKDCFSKLYSDITKLKNNTSRNKNYYKGLHESWLSSITYWTWGSFAWVYNWCSYETIYKEYSNFERENVVPLNWLIDNRTFELNKANDFFELIIKNLNSYETELENEFKISKLESVIRSINANIATIFELLRIPQ